MGSTKKLTSILPAALVAAGLAMPQAALAADLLIDPPVVEAPEIVQSGGWYLRGDIGYSWRETEAPMHSPYYDDTLSVKSTESDHTFDIGVGVGYQINENFRVDLTGTYSAESDFTGNSMRRVDSIYEVGGTSPGSPGNLDGAMVTTDVTSSYTAYSVLANAYVDLGTFSGLTPYVGAGLGGAYVSWGDTTSNSTCTHDAATSATTESPCPHPGTTGAGATTENPNWVGTDASSTNTFTQTGTEAWHFAWALHAGASYDLTHNTKIDLGYTYSRIESGGMFTGAYGGADEDGIQNHTIRAGIRYQIW